jgi:hypothetical protein
VVDVLGEVFEVLGYAGLLDVEARGIARRGHCGRPSTLGTSSTSPRKITFGLPKAMM